MDYKELFENEPSFLKIAEHYYNKNFGTMSKAEFELLMFTILCDKYREMDSDITPISLALDLGITVQRVDNLLEKMMLKKQRRNWLRFRGSRPFHTSSRTEQTLLPIMQLRGTFL